ncbi:polymer-forming cytoskeletal protein [Streptomyces sp. NPDC001508]|uniref:polymer-forming cytoskeletal protein n=1 Tax=Streptomyces sp. NPDC001508 TaxID=3154656 RepID=UPI003333CCC3
METIYQTWAETVTLFERRGFPQDAYDSLDEEEYILHPGPAALPGSLWLDDHQYRHHNPWIKAGGRPEYEGIDGAVTGYVIDGDLRVDGNILNLDYGSPSLIVLGDLVVANLVLSGTSHLLVQGDIEAETFVGTSTEQYVEVLGDLRATLAIMWDEFLPEVGGRLRGRALVPAYLDLDGCGLAVDDPAPHAGLADLVVPEVLLADGDTPGDDLYLADTGLRYEHMIDRMVRGLPVVRGGRTVTPLKELPHKQ